MKIFCGNFSLWRKKVSKTLNPIELSCSPTFFAESMTLRKHHPSDTLLVFLSFERTSFLCHTFVSVNFKFWQWKHFRHEWNFWTIWKFKFILNYTAKITQCGLRFSTNGAKKKVTIRILKASNVISITKSITTNKWLFT